MNLGKYEIEDQIAAAKWFGNQSYIDKSESECSDGAWWLYDKFGNDKGADVFKMGIAVAPVTNWRYYDSVYTERFMRTPQENPDGYDKIHRLNMRIY
jgi:dipeptidyl-peptidase-4